jgi:hypothetical protein
MVYFIYNNPWDSIKVKSSDYLKHKLLIGFFFQNPSHFHTDWVKFEGLYYTKVNLKQIELGLLGLKPIF